MRADRVGEWRLIATFGADQGADATAAAAAAVTAAYTVQMMPRWEGASATEKLGLYYFHEKASSSVTGGG